MERRVGCIQLCTVGSLKLSIRQVVKMDLCSRVALSPSYLVSLFLPVMERVMKAMTT